jgi:octaprenyl-diphosphate synthase
MFAADSKTVAAPLSKTLHAEPACSWKQIMDPIELFLDAVGKQLTQQVRSFQPHVLPYADYVLNGQGKQLRPALVALTANALGKAEESHVRVAVIIEMVHLATLVHDDVMDEAELRRGRLTMAANWGNEIAVLFGDCLFAQALKLAASFPTPEVCRAVAAATNTVCAGEILQTQHRRDFLFTQERYFEVLEMKTAELFALSCELSACLSGTAPEMRGMLRQFGLAFGTAYQLYDDCVDLFGSEAAAGKSLGTDLAKGKLTLPVLLAWERANPEDREHLRGAVEEGRNGAVKRLEKLLRKYETLNSSREMIHEYLNKARQIVRALPASKGCSGLLNLMEYLARQTDALGQGPENGL